MWNQINSLKNAEKHPTKLFWVTMSINIVYLTLKTLNEQIIWIKKFITKYLTIIS